VTRRVSVGRGGSQAHGASRYPAVSANGRYVAFVSAADNLVAGDTNGWADVFVRDRVAHVTRRVSGPGGTQANGFFLTPAISADGRHVAFSSDADDLVPGDTNGTADVFLRDLRSAERLRLVGREDRRRAAAPQLAGSGPAQDG
jgi:Tol biopolymer transport system component